MKHKYLIALCSTLLVIAAWSCKGSKDSGAKAYYKSLDDDLQTQIDSWKADPYGCTRSRTAPMAEAIVINFKEGGLTEPQIEELLGPAERSRVVGQVKQISYYFDGDCTDGKLRNGTVYCLAQFFLNLDTGKMESGGVVCG